MISRICDAEYDRDCYKAHLSKVAQRNIALEKDLYLRKVVADFTYNVVCSYDSLLSVLFDLLENALLTRSEENKEGSCALCAMRSICTSTTHGIGLEISDEDRKMYPKEERKSYEESLVRKITKYKTSLNNMVEENQSLKQKLKEARKYKEEMEMLLKELKGKQRVKSTDAKIDTSVQTTSTDLTVKDNQIKNYDYENDYLKTKLNEVTSDLERTRDDLAVTKDR